MKTHLTLESGPQAVVSSLRRLAMTNQMKTSKPAAKYAHLLPRQLASRLAEAHVFALGGLLEKSSADYLTWPRLSELMARTQAMHAQTGVSLPFPQTIFTECNPDSDLLSLIYLEQTETELHGSLFIHFLPIGEWWWIGQLRLERQGEIWSDAGGFRTEVPSAIGFPPPDANGRSPIAEHTALAIWCGLAMLDARGDTVIVEPAPSFPCPGKPKGFETPNPAVSILRICAPRVLRLGSPEPTGLIVRAHDRRGHYRHCGNRMIWVRDCKVHGGAAFPTAKIIKG